MPSLRGRASLRATNFEHSNWNDSVTEQDQRMLSKIYRLQSEDRMTNCSTCHRLELYAVVADAQRGQDRLVRFLSDARKIATAEFVPYLIVRAHNEVVDHLFRLAAGLASPVLGDSQILGQVSDAYAAAQQADQAVKADVIQDLHRNLKGNAATEEDWRKAPKRALANRKQSAQP